MMFGFGKKTQDDLALADELAMEMGAMRFTNDEPKTEPLTYSETVKLNMEKAASDLATAMRAQEKIINNATCLLEEYGRVYDAYTAMLHNLTGNSLPLYDPKQDATLSDYALMVDGHEDETVSARHDIVSDDPNTLPIYDPHKDVAPYIVENGEVVMNAARVNAVFVDKKESLAAMQRMTGVVGGKKPKPSEPA